MKSIKRYVLAFAIWFTIGILTIWLSLKDNPPTAEKSEWTINANR